MRSLVCAVAALFLSGCVTAQHRAPELEWTDFHLGMTIDETRSLDPSIGLDSPISAGISIPVRVSGLLFSGGLEYRDGHANRITFGGGGSISNAAECEAAFQRIVTDIEKVTALSGGRSPWPGGPEASIVTTPAGSRIYRHDDGNGREHSIAYRDGDNLLSAGGSFGPRESGSGADVCRLGVTLSTKYPPPTMEPPATQAELEAAPLLPHPQWIERPTPQAMYDAYPSLAKAVEVEGSVTLDCVVLDGGRLHCAIASEEPAADWGFGEAARFVARDLRIAPEVDGTPTVGKRVHFSIGFQLE
ncbi:MAG: hypothetical protein ABUL73_00630 [Alphaproteobacteria bacterium]